MQHGEENVCSDCDRARMSVVEVADRVLRNSKPGSEEQRIARVLKSLLKTLGTFMTIREQEDLLTRFGSGIVIVDTLRGCSEMLVYEQLLSAYKACTSKCTNEFGEGKCDKVE